MSELLNWINQNKKCWEENDNEPKCNADLECKWKPAHVITQQNGTVIDLPDHCGTIIPYPDQISNDSQQ